MISSTPTTFSSFRLSTRDAAASSGGVSEKSMGKRRTSVVSKNMKFRIAVCSDK